MEHPLDNNIMRCIDIKKLDDAGQQMIIQTKRSLGHARRHRADSVTRYCHARDALEYVMQAHAYGKNVADLITECRNELNECVGAQIREHANDE